MTFFGSKKKAEGKSQVQLQVPRKDPLRELVPNDEKLYLALQTFLLGDPNRQLPMLGSVDSLSLKADEERAKGDKWKARINYETAARIEIFIEDRAGAEKFLRQAEEFAEVGGQNRVMLETLLKNMDEVMRISKMFYSSISKGGK
jgi:hypothetical protein